MLRNVVLQRLGLQSHSSCPPSRSPKRCKTTFLSISGARKPKNWDLVVWFNIKVRGAKIKIWNFAIVTFSVKYCSVHGCMIYNNLGQKSYFDSKGVWGKKYLCWNVRERFLQCKSSNFINKEFHNTVKSLAVDRSTIQFWKVLTKGHST